MDERKTKSLKNIEEKMEGLDSSSLRYHILESAKNFKRSWIELGRSLYSVWKDKMYKEWGYLNFDVYVSREIGIRKQTAMKLLKSYYFLEKEEPQYLKNEYTEASQAANIPSYESVDILRQAKNKKVLHEDDYKNLKKEIFEKGRDAQELKKNLGLIIRQRQELDPQEAQEKRRLAIARRLLGQLRMLKQEAEILKMLPMPIIKELDALIKKIDLALGA
jgi:Xaa-Pro aminopeptidase